MYVSDVVHCRFVPLMKLECVLLLLCSSTCTVTQTTTSVVEPFLVYRESSPPRLLYFHLCSKILLRNNISVHCLFQLLSPDAHQLVLASPPEELDDAIPCIPPNAERPEEWRRFTRRKRREIVSFILGFILHILLLDDEVVKRRDSRDLFEAAALCSNVLSKLEHYVRIENDIFENCSTKASFLFNFVSNKKKFSKRKIERSHVNTFRKSTCLLHAKSRQTKNTGILHQSFQMKITWMESECLLSCSCRFSEY